MNEIELVKELVRLYNDNFETKAAEIATASELTKQFTVTNFSDLSLDDALVKHEEFGLIYAESSDWEFQFRNGPNKAGINTVTINIQVILAEKENTFAQIAIARQALVRLLLDDDLEFLFQNTNFQITSTTPIDISPKGTENRYIGCGIKVAFKIGV